MKSWKRSSLPLLGPWEATVEAVLIRRAVPGPPVPPVAAPDRSGDMGRGLLGTGCCVCEWKEEAFERG